MAPHLLVPISSHGFGHVAQVAPVVNALRRRLPGLRVTLRTAALRGLLESRFEGPFGLQAVADDFGMVQRSALAVDLEASAARYRAFHEGWEARVEAVAAELERAEPDLVLADVPYLTLAAAARASIPSCAICSLNWADIYGHYCRHRPEAGAILEQMDGAYQSARLFLRPAPSMAMPGLANGLAIGPVGAVGVNRRDAIAERCGWRAGEKIVLVSLGGIATRLPAERWPRVPGVRWIFQRDWEVRRDDAVVVEELGIAFSDLLASCDLLLAKPGYGSFVEATAAGVPVLYVTREEWPEAEVLIAWLHGHGRGAPLSPERAASGEFADILSELLAGNRAAPLPMSGNEEAAALIAGMLPAP